MATYGPEVRGDYRCLTTTPISKTFALINKGRKPQQLVWIVREHSIPPMNECKLLRCP